MSTGSDPLALWRAAFRDACRRADPIAAARAAARLHGHAEALSASEFIAAREARLALGRGIRDARARRAPAVVVASVPRQSILLRRPRRFPVAAAAALILAIALSTWLVVPRDTGDGGAGGGAPAAVVPDTAVPITAQSRGRVVLALAAAAPVVEQPQVSAPPSLAPAATAAPAAPTGGPSAAAGSARPGGSGAPGAGGTGSGGPGGSGSPAPATPGPTPSPVPTLAVCSPIVQRGQARLCGQVADAAGRPLAGACVSQGPCKSTSTLTDRNGRWQFLVATGSGNLAWNLEFSMTGYVTTKFTQTPAVGRNVYTLPQQRLQLAQ